jgi:Uma2 family endonuclease
MTGAPTQPLERRRMTKTEFCALPEGPPDCEFEHGELIPMLRPQSRHQSGVTALAWVLEVYVARNRLGRCWVKIDVDLTQS